MNIFSRFFSCNEIVEGEDIHTYLTENLFVESDLIMTNGSADGTGNLTEYTHFLISNAFYQVRLSAVLS